MASLPRATVTESNGEVACSIEETNRIRAALGLRPLDVGGGATPALPPGTGAGARAAPADDPDTYKTATGAAVVDTRVDSRAEAEKAAIAARIERARREREDAELAARGGLGDALKASGAAAISTAAWVAMSRTAGAGAGGGAGAAAVPRASRPRMAAAAADEYEATLTAGATRRRTTAVGSELAGVRVAHDAAAFESGPVILTLADTNLLDAKGSALADDGDTLVNADTAAKEAAAAAAERRRRAAGPLQTAYDDEEFAMAPGGAAAGAAKKGVLAHYDDYDVGDSVGSKRATRLGGEQARAGMVIGEGGIVIATAEDDEDAPTSSARAANGGDGIDVGLAGDGAPRLMSEFQTHAEAEQAQRGAGRKKKALRRVGASAGEDGDAGQAAAADVLAAAPAVAGRGDHGSRAARRAAADGTAGGGTWSGSGSLLASAADMRAEAEARANQHVAFSTALGRATAAAAQLREDGDVEAEDGEDGEAAAAAAEAVRIAQNNRDFGAVLPADALLLGARGGGSAPSAATSLNAHTKQRVYTRLRDQGEASATSRGAGADGGGGDDAPAAVTANGVGDDADDAELAAVLARARRLAATRAPGSRGSGAGAAVSAAVTVAAPSSGDRAAHVAAYTAAEVADPGAAGVAAMLARLQRASDVKPTFTVKPDPAAAPAAQNDDGGGDDAPIVFTATTAFSDLVSSRLYTRQVESAEHDAAAGSQVPIVPAITTRVEGGDEVLAAAVAGMKRKRTAGGPVGGATDATAGAPPAQRRRRWQGDAGTTTSAVPTVDGERGSGEGGASSGWVVDGEGAAGESDDAHPTHDDGGEGVFGGHSDSGSDSDSDDSETDDDSEDGAEGDDAAAAAAASGSFTAAERAAPQGLGGTLSLLLRSGELRSEELMVGRNKDRKQLVREAAAAGADAGGAGADKDVVLEYRDEHGRLLTMQEAYRQLSYKFHGYKPTRAQQERYLRREQRKRERAAKATEGNSKLLKALQRTQEATGSAFVKL